MNSMFVRRIPIWGLLFAVFVGIVDSASAAQLMNAGEAYGVGFSPDKVASADFNGDGLPDFAASIPADSIGSISNFVAVILHTTDPDYPALFGPPTRYVVANRPVDI